MNAAHDDERLWQEALDLLFRLRDDPRDPSIAATVKAWQGRSAAHRAAWAEAERVWELTGRAAHVEAVLPPHAIALSRGAPSHGVSRRWLLAGAGVAAGAAVLAAGPDFVGRARADYVTQAGEVRKVAMPDGSDVTLGPETAIALDFSAETRRVELLDGVAFFQVARRMGPSFQVSCQGLTTTAVATAATMATGVAFEVSRDAGLQTASVIEGRIAVRVPAGRRDTALQAGEWLTFDESSGAIDSGRRELDQIAAWRQRQIVAEREPIRAVVAKIARWHAGRVVVVPGFGERRVSGVFDLNDPTAALEAVVAPFGGRVRHVTPWLTVLAAI